MGEVKGEWKSFETAPKDGTPIQADIPGNGTDNVIEWVWGFHDSEGDVCGCWVFSHEDQEPPACWTDGVCWEVNEDGVPSAHPTRWKPLPSTTSPLPDDEVGT